VGRLLVQKYGGSSLDSPARIKQVAARIAASAELSHRIIVVVSAMGRTTDELLGLAHQVSTRPQRRELDMLLTVGERISMALLSMALNDLGCPAISFTGSQSGIITTMSHTRALIEEIKPRRIEEALEEKKAVIVAGFQGVSRSREVTTLGRGGSDTTAVALAAVFRAERCEVYSDFPGIFSADPRIVPGARRIPALTYDEVLELAALGAKVLHYRAADLARRYRVPLVLRSSFSEGPGTEVVEGSAMESPYFRSVTGRENCHLLRIACPSERAVELAEAASSADVKLTLYQSSQQHAEAVVTVVVEDNGLARFREVLSTLGDCVRVDGEIEASTVSVVGGGFACRPHGVALVTKCLAREGIPLLALTSSALSITCVVPRERWKEALETLHRELPFDEEPSSSP